MSTVDDSIWDEVVSRLIALEVITARQSQELQELKDRVYQPYRVKPAEEWPPADARVGGSD